MNPKTKQRIDRIVYRVNDYLTPGQAAALREIVEHELREQDRDTRHACAEAVLSIRNEDVLFSSQRAVDRAHAACINTSAI